MTVFERLYDAAALPGLVLALSCSTGDQWVGSASHGLPEPGAGGGSAGTAGATCSERPCTFAGLVARWPLDGDFGDELRRFPGEPVDSAGAPAPGLGFTDGVLGSAADFREARSLVRFAPDATLAPEDFSLIFWANSPGTSLDFAELLVAKGRDCLSNYHCSILPRGDVRCLIQDDRGSCVDGFETGLSVSTPWPVLTWTQVVFTVEQDAALPSIRLQLFVDGALHDTVQAEDTRVVDNPEWPLLFGGHYQEPTGVGMTPYFSHALLDEVELYDRALTASEVRAQYEAAAP